MNPDLFESRMRQGEAYHSLRVPPGMWIVVRVDGRSFSRLTEERFEKPFDPAMHECMTKAAAALLEELQAVYAYTESDEISVLVDPSSGIFDREVEKIVSVSAGIASSAFSLASGHAGHFDGRVWVGAGEGDVVDYFRWRQADATRCAINGWCYWTLRKAGKSAPEATKTLRGATVAQLNETLFQHGINFNEVPLWQRRGAGLYWEEYEKDGLNPVTNERTTARRRRIKIDRELPMKDEYSRFILALIEPKIPRRPAHTAHGGDDAE